MKEEIIMTYVCSSLQRELINNGWDRQVAAKYSDYLSKKSYQVRTGRTAYSDSTRSKTYKAEWDFEQKNKALIKQFDTERDAQQALKNVLRSKMWEDIAGGKRVTLIVRKLGSTVAGRAYYGSIELCASKGMSMYTLLHELAHAAGHMHHDVSFRVTLVKLVSRFMGVEAAKELKKSFRNHKLKMTVSTKILEPNDWLQNYNKMKNVRMLKKVS